MAFLDASGPLVIDRDTLGAHVRVAWVRWAKTQDNPKPSWLVPWGMLPESDREADRQIGEHICRLVMLSIAARSGSPTEDDHARLIDAAPDLRDAGERIVLRASASQRDEYLISGDDFRMLQAAVHKARPGCITGSTS